MDMWVRLGFRNWSLQQEKFSNGIAAKLVEVFPKKHQSYHAILLYRGRDKDPFAELRIHELKTIGFLVNDLFEYFQEEVASRAAQQLADAEEQAPKQLPG